MPGATACAKINREGQDRPGDDGRGGGAMTDTTEAAIARMRETMHPMEAKISLGKQIVADFHAGKLAGHPPEKSVPAGEGIVAGK